MTIRAFLHSTQGAEADAPGINFSSPTLDLPSCGGRDGFERIASTFQMLLSEESIPLHSRFWLSRFQAPLYRIALYDLSFTWDPKHPARRVLNTLFVLALDAGHEAEKSASAEREIKRSVQLVEQFPDYGVHSFSILLKDLFTRIGALPHLSVSTCPKLDMLELLAQRDELIIRFTIDLRETIKGLRMNCHFRHFFLSVWPKVLARSALLEGSSQIHTRRLREIEPRLFFLSQQSGSDAPGQHPDMFGVMDALQKGLDLISIETEERRAYLLLFSQSTHQL